MRFRHKLSIVLVGLAIVPLAATGVLVAALLEHDQVTRVDNRVAVSAQAAAQAYQAQAGKAGVVAQEISHNRNVQLMFTGKQPTKKLHRTSTSPAG